MGCRQVVNHLWCLGRILLRGVNRAFQGLGGFHRVLAFDLIRMFQGQHIWYGYEIGFPTSSGWSHVMFCDCKPGAPSEITQLTYIFHRRSTGIHAYYQCVYIYMYIYGVCVTVFVPHVQISSPFKTSFIGHFSSYPCLIIAGYSQLFLYILLQFHNSIVHENISMISPLYHRSSDITIIMTIL